MVEREIEKQREREPEPETNYYDLHRERQNKLVETHKQGKRVIKFKDLPWEVSKMAIVKFYSTTHKQDMAAPYWRSFLQRVDKHSGKHKHQGGLPIFILEGKGYSVVDGVRYNWKKGDLLLLPIKPGGCEHQHFNENPDEPVNWVALRWYPFSDFLICETKMVELHPDYKPKK